MGWQHVDVVNCGARCRPAMASAVSQPLGWTSTKVSHLRNNTAQAFPSQVCLVLLRQTITLIAVLCICVLQVLPNLTKASASLPLPAPRGITSTPVALRRARAHAPHSHPSSSVYHLITRTISKKVRRTTKRHNGVPRHISCTIRLCASERQRNCAD